MKQAVAYPLTLPLEKWTNAWLEFETAAKLDCLEYLAMTETQRIEHAFPASRTQRIIFIKECWMIN